MYFEVLAGLKDSEMVAIPLSTYCCKCDVLLVRGQTVLKYDGASYSHVECPNRPLRRFALSRLPEPGTYKYPMTIHA